MINGPIISGTIAVQANTIYSVQIELLATDLSFDMQYASWITLGNTSFGSCDPNPELCGCYYVTCSSLKQTTISTTTTTLPVEIGFTAAVQPVCDCSGNGKRFSAAARINLRESR